MTSALQRLPKHTVKLTITIPWEDVKGTYQKVLDQVVSEAEVPGFRKGKAPRKIVEEKIDKSHLYEEVIKQLVPDAYAKVIKEHSLKPVVSPRISVVSASENKDWQFEAITCEQPEVKLKNYRQEIVKLKGAKKIWVPGKDLKQQKEDDKKGVELSEVLRILLNESEVAIPDILIEEQANKKLADLIDQVRQMGMTVEQYLMSKGLTNQQLRAQYAKEAEETLKLEFILEKVADNEKITITDQEINEAIEAIKDTTQKEALKNQKYYISMILRRQKTLDSLTKPIV